MRIILIIACLWISPSHAGWFNDVCERLMIVADDPYQYEDWTDGQLAKEYRRVGGLLYYSYDEELAYYLRHLGLELRKRTSIAVSDALLDYSELEYKPGGFRGLKVRRQRR